MRFGAGPTLFKHNPQDYKRMMISHKMCTSDDLSNNQDPVFIATHICLTARLCVHYRGCPKDLWIVSFNEQIYTLLLATTEKTNDGRQNNLSSYIQK